MRENRDQKIFCIWGLFRQCLEKPINLLLTFYKKCINDLGHLFKYLQVQFRGTTGEDESMEVGAITVEYMSTVLINAADW